MNLYYENSAGNIIDFMSGPLAAQSPETLIKNQWKYSTIASANGLSKVKKFYKELQTAPLKVSVFADSKEEFNDVMYQMHKTFDTDVRRVQTGKLWWNDFYMPVFAVTSSYDEFEEFFDSVEATVEFMSVYPYWIKTISNQYFAITEALGALDFPYDYNLYDFVKSDSLEIINNTCIGEANFEIIFYGPAVNPSVTIGGHLYELGFTLDKGEYAVINSVTQKIKAYSITGDEENIFHTRNKESYIFKKIPEGKVPVLRNKDLAVDINIFDERGEPEWI